MCGIAGIFGAWDRQAVEGMLAQLRYRGPDDEFCIGGKDFTLGACRLSIIDIGGGRQPIPNETEEIWVVQNGEIYNHPALMEGLKRAGHSFRSRSDTEVLVHLYEEKEEQFLSELNGMFAIAIWDDRKKRGFLARDRIGEKPLYYHLSDSGILYFSSEIKALLTLPFLSKKIHWPALNHFLSYKHIPAPLSIYEEIRSLPPAHALVFAQDDSGKNYISVERYWRLDFSRIWTQGLSEEEIVEALLDQLKKSVERRLISDVPIGFLLSGGIDSGLCTALAATCSPQPINTFTLAYGAQSTNPAKERDREYAAQVARRYNTCHHEGIIEAAHLEEEIPKIMSHFDEPFSGVISTYFLARVMSQHVKVAISGDGADELFGSYLSHRLAVPMEAYLRDGNEGLSLPETVHLDERDRAILKKIADNEVWRWRHKLMVFTDSEKTSLCASEVTEQFGDLSSLQHLRSYFDQLTAQDPLNRILEAEFNSQLPDQVLTYVDRLSMAHSLEVRSAYLDRDFVELAAGIEGCWKIRDGRTKYILKKAALRYLPADLVYQSKEGFLMPINQWLLQDMEPYVRASLSPARLRKQGIFNPDYVKRLLENFYQRQLHLGTKIWTLIAFQIWYETYLDG